MLPCTGTLPPFGHATAIPVIVDIRLALQLPSKAALLAALSDLIQDNLSGGSTPTNVNQSEQSEAGVVCSTPADIEIETNDLNQAHSSTEAGFSNTSDHDSSTRTGGHISLIDSLASDTQHLLYCGSGASNAIIECTALELLAMSNGSLADITDSPATLSPSHESADPAATASPECAGSHTSSCGEWMGLASMLLPGVRFLQSEAGAARESALQAAKLLQLGCAPASSGFVSSTDGCPGDSGMASGGSAASNIAAVKQAGGNAPVGHAEGLLVFVVLCMTQCIYQTSEALDPIVCVDFEPMLRRTAVLPEWS